jgi:hypothetical protein
MGEDCDEVRHAFNILHLAVSYNIFCFKIDHFEYTRDELFNASTYDWLLY